MKPLITLILVIAAIWGIRELQSHWKSVKATQEAADPRRAEPAAKPASPDALPGMPPGLEAGLQTAKKQGAASLKVWLKSYRGYLSDPRLADIELDYVLLLGSSNLKEARAVFAAVQQRVPTNSPVYPRIRQLEKTYR